MVALEEKDVSGVDRVIMETVTDGIGGFIFCPVAARSYDGALSPAMACWPQGATITGVQAGSSLGTVPLGAQPGTVNSPASMSGQMTSSTGSAGTAADISLSALQPGFRKWNDRPGDDSSGGTIVGDRHRGYGDGCKLSGKNRLRRLHIICPRR